MSDESIIDAAGSNIDLFEGLYEQYKADKNNVSEEWQEILAEFDHRQTFAIQPKTFPKSQAPPSQSANELKILQLINAYRHYGHLAASFDPLKPPKDEEPKQLNLGNFGFTQGDLSTAFPTCGILAEEKAPLLEIIKVLKEIYASRIGIEYMGFQSPELEAWVQDKVEKNRAHLSLTIEQKQSILQQLNKSELLESFLHTKYVGQKRFSIEGGESFVPMLSFAIERGADLGLQEFYLGMAHRGRLNVLSNILNKSYSDIFSEFEEGYFPDSFEGSGDVKYHKGFFSDVQTIHGNKVQVTLTPNPSHLESVNPVVEGQVRARQDKIGDQNREKVTAILIHGDAALAGQGVIYETLQLYQLEGYTTGGTLHIVINNQIGFTTLPKDARSTYYCTDIAKTFGAPVFHVNAEDPESCVLVTLLAIEIRQKFHCDVFIDLNCYRKYGHNESDEPAFTQPVEYQLIRSKKSIREIYRDDLIKQGVLEKYMAESLEAEFKKALAQAIKSTKPVSKVVEFKQSNGEEDLFMPVDTAVSYSVLREVAEQICSLPNGFNIHPKLANLLKERLSMVVPKERAKPLDWGMAELLAYGSLVYNGIDMRLSGQDCCRGTFSHRHALWMDQKNEKAYFPLSHIAKTQGRSEIINSLLSEFAALGFEFGYSLAYLEALVIWEAQFGDFANGAQVVIDQYIATAEQKWGQKSNLTLLLPHGYEGQGPEHSSARLERFLTLAGNNNMIITNPTTPAQLFHLLRRQALSPWKKPLVALSPKGLLRHSECVSSIKDLEKGHFEEVIDDPLKPKKVNKLLFCSGRIYYDLDSLRKKEHLDEIAIVRIEQLYPLNEKKIAEIINHHEAARYYWVQDEPQNMGAWNYVSPILQQIIKKEELQYVGRKRSASPAAGSYAQHKKEQAEILNVFLEPNKSSPLDISHHFRV